VPPRTIPFIKAVACGNDFLLIDSRLIDSENPSTPPPHKELASITRRICDRREGVGADGVEWLYPHPSADAEIRLINSDGSDAEISGNGTRCVAACICAQRRKENIKIQTGAGLKTCVLTRRTDSDYEFEAAMGEATIQPELALKLDRRNITGIPVSMGNPHYVTFMNEFPKNWQNQASEIQRNSNFKQGVNIEFVIVHSRHDVRARFFERGAGETQSSGTGSCAVAVAAITSGKAESPVSVHTPGGVQTVRLAGGQIFLRGTARLICKGEFSLSSIAG
jgi:diaminopimelate epimerase